MSKHVLIIDDDEATRKLLRSFFLSKNCDSAEVALDGRDALNKLKVYKPDVIVLDVMMPVLDGYGFMRELKQLEPLRKIPVVVLTAREMMRDVFVLEGVKDFVTKPFDVEVLYKIVSQYFT
jgi:two-component system chemotaxis response regulator CheY